MSFLSRSLVILLIDPDGRRSAIARAVRRAGHRVVVATGLDTAEVVLGTMRPNLVIVRSLSAERDREALGRLEEIARGQPVRLIDAPTEIDDALEAVTSTN